MDRKLERRLNFIFYTTTALAFTLVATVTLLSGPALVYALAALAMSTAWLGGTRKRATLSLHGAVYIVASAVASSMPVYAVDALVGPAVPARNWINPPVLVMILAAAVFCWFPVATHGRTLGATFAKVPKFTVLTLVALALGGIATTLGADLLPKHDGEAIDLQTLAPLRTLILAGAAILLAWICRLPRLKEAAWLVYPVLIAGGLRLLVEDLRTGKPLTLVVSFTLYGFALILSPRLVRQS